MKKKIFIVVSVTAVAILYYFSVSGLKGTEKTQSAVSSTTQDTFTNCIFNTGYSVMRLKPELNLFTNLDSFNALNFNAIQWYDWAGSDSFGRYDVPDLTPTQINNFNNAINTVNNKDLLGFYERSFLSYYCYGQRLIYEVPSNNNDITTNYGFVYKNIETGTITTDEGRSVIYADSGQDNQGYLCKNINENLQHTDLFSFRQDDKEKWYLKPVMKIPVNVNDTTRVVRVEIISFDGSPLDSIIIKAENFRNKGIYSDDYFGFGLQHNLQVYGDQHGTDPYLSKGITDPWENWDDNCKIDFRVYWYGLCDVWFDQMIVDDQRANYLFNLQNQGLVNERIIKEAESFANTPGNYSFFMDEVTISQVPCMKYVFEKMRDSVPDVKISFATTDYLHIRGLKKDSLPYTVYFDSLQPSFLQQDAHKFDMWSGGTILPESIPEEDRDPLLNPDLFETIELYNTRLQTQALGYKT